MELETLLAAPALGLSVSGTVLLVIIIVIIILKGMALYKAARLKEKGWFWIMLLLNTVGILPLIYLYLKRKKRI